MREEVCTREGTTAGIETLKGISNVASRINETVNPYSFGEETPGTENGEFRITGSNLPAKVGIWTKVKNVLLYEVIKVELTPYQQKMDDEIQAFFKQEITMKKVKDFLFQEISFGKKK